MINIDDGIYKKLVRYQKKYKIVYPSIRFCANTLILTMLKHDEQNKQKSRAIGGRN